MQSLEEAEEKARSFGTVVCQSIGQHLVQVVPVRDSMSRNTEIVYRLDGWDRPRLEIVRVFAGVEPEPIPTYGEYLEGRVNAGLHIGPVTGR
jgi:hypothetical protein